MKWNYQVTCLIVVTPGTNRLGRNANHSSLFSAECYERSEQYFQKETDVHGGTYPLCAYISLDSFYEREISGDFNL